MRTPPRNARRKTRDPAGFKLTIEGASKFSPIGLLLSGLVLVSISLWDPDSTVQRRSRGLLQAKRERRITDIPLGWLAWPVLGLGLVWTAQDVRKRMKKSTER